MTCGESISFDIDLNRFACKMRLLLCIPFHVFVLCLLQVHNCLLVSCSSGVGGRLVKREKRRKGK